MSKSLLHGLPPAPEQALPALTSLTKAAPSPLLQWQLLAILYSYTFVMRVYNGEYSSDAQVCFPCAHDALLFVCTTTCSRYQAYAERVCRPCSLDHCDLQHPNTVGATLSIDIACSVCPALLKQWQQTICQ